MLLVGVGAGVVVVLLNVFVIGCCLHKRNEKRLKRGTKGRVLLPHGGTTDSVIGEDVVLRLLLTLLIH